MLGCLSGCFSNLFVHFYFIELNNHSCRRYARLCCYIVFIVQRNEAEKELEHQINEFIIDLQVFPSVFQERAIRLKLFEVFPR